MRDGIGAYGVTEEKYLQIEGIEEREFDWLLQRTMPGP